MWLNWLSRNSERIVGDNPPNVEYEVQDVYCQHCTASLTGKEVVVSYISGSVYCPPENGHRNGCLFPASLSGRESTAVGTEMNSDELQRAIIKSSNKNPIKYQKPQNSNPGITLDRLVRR